MRILLVRLTHYFQKEQWISLTFLELESSMVYYALKLTYRGFFWLVVKLHWMGFASGYQQNQQWLATDWTEQHLQLDVWMNRCGGIFHLIQRPVFTNLFLTGVCVDLLIERVRSGSGGAVSFTCEAVVRTYPLLTTHAASKHFAV